MSQSEVLDLLEKNIKNINKLIDNIDKEEEIEDIIWKEALGKEDFINLIGVSLKSVSTSLAKLALKDKILRLKNKKKDGRIVKYVIRDECFDNLVNSRINK